VKKAAELSSPKSKPAITSVERQAPGIGWIFAGHKSPATTQQWYIDAERAYAAIPRPDYQ